MAHALIPDPPNTIDMKGDNQSAIATAKAPTDAIASPRTKHIDIRFHIIRETLQNGTIRHKYLRTTDMVADILTKALPFPTFQRHAIGMSLRHLSDFLNS